jgi:hypothetical protein
MLRRVLVFLALYCGAAATAFAAAPLDEVRRSFTIGGRPIPPEIFADFGDAMLSDSRPIVVTIYRFFGAADKPFGFALSSLGHAAQ